MIGIISYTYDPIGLLESVTDWNGDTTAFTNNADGQVATILRPNGIMTVNDYDVVGRNELVTHSDSGGVVESFLSVYDENSNRIAIETTSTTYWQYSDVLNRVFFASYGAQGNEDFLYDAAGNRTSVERDGGLPVTSTFDAAGQLISSSDGISYTYDQAGNLTGNSAGDSFTYDAYNRVVSATAGGVTETYVYDGDDVRVDVDGDAQLWDRGGGLAQLIAVNNENYLQPNGQYLATIDATSTSYGLADALGSTRFAVDDTGATTGATSYEVFGEVLTGTVDTFGFAGEQHDPTGLMHLRARQYNPTSGSFLSVDTVQPNAPGTGGYNLYAYAGNNPGTWTDPTGHTAAGYATLLSIPAVLATALLVDVAVCLGVAPCAEMLTNALKNAQQQTQQDLDKLDQLGTRIGQYTVKDFARDFGLIANWYFRTQTNSDSDDGNCQARAAAESRNLPQKAQNARVNYKSQNFAAFVWCVNPDQYVESIRGSVNQASDDHSETPVINAFMSAYPSWSTGTFYIHTNLEPCSPQTGGGCTQTIQDLRDKYQGRVNVVCTFSYLYPEERPEYYATYQKIGPVPPPTQNC